MCKISGVKLLWSSYLARLTTAIPLCFSRSMAPQLPPRYFWILSKENCLHDEALKRCTPRTYLGVDSCEAPQRMSYTAFFFFFFFLNRHSGLLTVCAQARVTPQLKGQTRILKVTLLEPNNPRLRADFFFYVLFFRGSVSPRRCHRHNAASELPISLAGMWRGCLIRLSSLAQTLSEMLGTFLHFYSKMHKPYNKRRRVMMWKSQRKKKKVNTRHNFSFRINIIFWGAVF